MINNLTEAILNIGKTTNSHGDIAIKEVVYSRWNARYSKTLGDFYSDFIERRLPNKDIILKWHDMLMEYSEMDGAIFPIRDGHSDTKDESKIKLRRGWLVRVDYHLDYVGKFSYTFTDNYFPAYIYKMALDGYCPTAKEFFDFMTKTKYPEDIDWLKGKSGVKNPINEVGQKRKFFEMPIRFGQFGKTSYPGNTEAQKNVYINTSPAPACDFGRFSYKHAHIFAVKKDDKNNNGIYVIEGKNFKWSELRNKYVELGEESPDKKDYLWDASIENYAWHRKMKNAEEREILRKVVIAHFMRFCDPINHFLAPLQGDNKFTKENGEYSLDIAEYNNLLMYLMYIRENAFGASYDEFKKIALVSNDVTSYDYSTENVEVIYHEKNQEGASKKNKADLVAEKAAKKAAQKAVKTCKAKSSTKAKGSSTSVKKTVTSSTVSVRAPRGENEKVVFTILNQLISRGLMDSTMIKNLTDRDFSKGAFGLSSYPFLLREADFASTGFSRGRFYTQTITIDGEIYLVCSQCSPEGINRLKNWYILL